MRMLLCTDLLLETMCTNINDYELSLKWRELRMGKFNKTINDEANKSLDYVILLGHLFSTSPVRSRTYESFFDIVKEHNDTKFLVFLNNIEYKRILYKKDIPDNLKLIPIESTNTYSDDNYTIKTNDYTIEFLENNNLFFGISKKSNDKFFITYDRDKTEEIFNFEPIGYEDFKNKFGYLILENKDNIFTCNPVENCMFTYGIVNVELSNTDKIDGIAVKILDIILKYKQKSIIKINLTGRVSREVEIDTDELAGILCSKVFYADISNNTIIDVDKEALTKENPSISEFLQTVFHEELLSDVDKSKIIVCAWNELLKGKGGNK